MTAIPTPAPVPDGVSLGVNPRCVLYHDIGAGDDCSTIGLKCNIPLKDSLFLNFNAWDNCTNPWLDYSHCVQAVGNISTYPGYLGGPSPILPHFTPEPSTSIPWSAIPTKESLLGIPLANETRIDCWNYIWINNTDSGWLNCWDHALAAGLSRAQFALWNPSIDQNVEDADAPSYEYDCALVPSLSYCIALASPTQALTAFAPRSRYYLPPPGRHPIHPHGGVRKLGAREIRVTVDEIARPIGNERSVRDSEDGEGE